MVSSSSEAVPLMSGDGAMALKTMAPSTSKSQLTTTTIAVEGMTCGACSSAIESGFKDVRGVESVSVSLILNRAVVVHDAAIIKAEDVAERIEDRGFDASIISSIEPKKPKESKPQFTTTTVGIEGMTCSACTSAVESGLQGVDGVQSVSVSLIMNRAVVIHDSAIISAKAVAEIIDDRGFDAAVISSVAPKQATVHFATTTVDIEGMTCGACTSAVESAFKGVEGVGSVSVSLVLNRAVVQHHPSIITAEAVAELIEDRGFDTKVVSTNLTSDDLDDDRSQTVILKIYGLQDSGSVADAERIMRNVPGVTSAVLIFSTAKATIEYSPECSGIRSIVEAIEAGGYNALLAESEDTNAQLESLAKTKEIQEWRRAFYFSLSFAIPVFLISMIIPMWLKPLDFGKVKILLPGLYLGDVVVLFLTIPVQFGIGKRFYISAYKSVMHGSATMDVLVVLGTSAAFFFSIVSMLISLIYMPHTRPATVFDTCTMLITFITLGRYLENKAKGQTSKALSRLMSLAPSMATIYVNHSAVQDASLLVDAKSEDQAHEAGVEERVIPTELIQVGDVVVLRPGDKIPADGVVTAGESYVDESMVTGEAMPIHKFKGSALIGGTVNAAGRLDFRVTRAGRDTQLSQIVKLVQEAQTSRAPIQKLADIVAGYFVPGVVSLGVITFIGWMILSHVLPHPPAIFMNNASGGKLMVCMKLCISVIVFACPCALGLSTPTAVMVGTGVGAENGILVKGGAALETATKITKVVLDKTGTLTMGRMSVANFSQGESWSSSESKIKIWWLLVGIAEQGSEHPIGKAIALGAKSQLGLGPEVTLEGVVTDFQAVVGRGVSALVKPGNRSDGKQFRVLIGNAAFLEQHDVAVPKGAESEASGDGNKPTSKEKEQSGGQTFVFVAIDGVFAGFVALSDELKKDARYTIDALRRMGIKVAMVTGDQRSTALQVAREVGIEPSQVWAGVSPDEKQAIIATMKSEGEVVAMVGDGINDSPALATADVGIAMASGTDVAMEAADIVLMKPNSLLDIPAALHLAGTIFGRIKLNLFWACGYNIIGMPFAMGFFLPLGLHLHPMAAGAAMAASSVSVVSSSLLLKFWKRPHWMTLQGIEEEGMRLKQMDGDGKWWRFRGWFSKRRNEGEGYAVLENADV